MKISPTELWDIPVGFEVDRFEMHGIMVGSLRGPHGLASFRLDRNLIAFPYTVQPIRRQINDDKPYDTILRPGNISVARAGTMVRSDGKGERHLLMLAINDVVENEILDEAKGNGWSAKSDFSFFTDDTSYRAAQLLESISRVGKDGAWFDFSEYLIMAIVSSVTSQLGIDEYIRPKSEGLSAARYLRVIDYINENSSRHIMLVELANVAALSVFHFSRAFARTAGMTPMRYVMMRRVECAKGMIKVHSEMSLAVIADACGFASQSHLTTVFKKIVGMTPAAFRREIR